MKAAALRALQINDKLAEAHTLMSNLAWAEDDFQTEEREARIAIRLNPNLAEAHYILGRFLMTTGYPQSFLKSLETAHNLDPLSSHYARYLGLILAFAGRDQEALDLLNKYVTAAPFEMHLAKAEYYLGKKEFDQADTEIKELEVLSPSDFHTLSFRGFFFAMKKDKDRIQKIIRQLDHDFSGGATLDRTIGYFAYMFGDMGGLFGAMSRAVEGHVFDPFRMRYSPIFESARRDPRYRELMKKHGIDPDLKEPFS